MRQQVDLPDRDFASVTAGEDADGFDGAWSLTAFAACVDADVPVTIASAVSPFDADPAKSLTMSCPPGTKVLGTSFAGGVANLSVVATTLIGPRRHPGRPEPDHVRGRLGVRAS
jgi:hypothetical protein